MFRRDLETIQLKSNANNQDLLSSLDIATRFCLGMVNLLIVNMAYISSADHLLEIFAFFDTTHAVEVYDCFQQLFKEDIR